MLNLGLKLARFMLDPFNEFKDRYIALNGGHTSFKSKKLDIHLQEARKHLCKAIQDILRLQLHIKSDFIQDCLNFYKNSELKELCHDCTSTIWGPVD